MDSAILKQIKKLRGNSFCIDCGSSDPSWTSLSHATLMCMECASKHRALGVKVSFVRSLEFDTFTEKEIEKMFKGGNLKFEEFCIVHEDMETEFLDYSSDSEEDSEESISFESVDGTVVSVMTQDVFMRYKSIVAELYREVLDNKVEGKPLPTMSDILLRRLQKKNPNTSTPPPSSPPESIKVVMGNVVVDTSSIRNIASEWGNLMNSVKSLNIPRVDKPLVRKISKLRPFSRKKKEVIKADSVRSEERMFEMFDEMFVIE